MGVEQVLMALQCPWQDPYCERVIGTLRRDCLGHVIVLGEQHLRRIPRKYLVRNDRNHNDAQLRRTPNAPGS